MPKKKKKYTKFDALSCHEVLDRLAMIEHLVDEDICGHHLTNMKPINKQHKRLIEECEKALYAVHSAYCAAYEFSDKSAVK